MKTIDTKKLKWVKFTGGKSYRFVLKRDAVGFAMMRTEVDGGGTYLWHYKNHQEVCYCVSGVGEVKDLTTGEVHRITQGVAYVVDKHQPHEFTAITDVTLISVFNPPLRGDETHDSEGNYI